MSDATTLPAPDLRLREATQAVWQEERRAFLRPLPTLLSTHRDRYVAVHRGPSSPMDQTRSKWRSEPMRWSDMSRSTSG